MKNDIWNKYYNEALEYYKENNNLIVPYNYVTKNNIKLGVWIRTQRYKYKINELNIDKIELLNKINMVWQIRNFDSWDSYYNEAKQYYEKYNDLLIPENYINENNYKLGIWIQTQKRKYKSNKLSDKQITLLNKIGLDLGKTYSNWDDNYLLALEYYKEHNNLLIPYYYKINDINLGKWLLNQRALFKQNKLSKEKIDLLNKINMVWENNDYNWNENYKIAKNYYLKHKKLCVKDKLLTEDEKKLRNWLVIQRVVYKGKNNSILTDEQIELLDKIKIKWFSNKIDLKLQNEIINKNNKNRKEKEILNRFKSYLNNYDKNTLPSKDEINNGFIKQLKK